METLLGIWLDHSHAEVVAIRGGQVERSTIASEVGRKHRALGGTRVPGRNNMQAAGASEKNVARHRSEQIARFYRRLIPAIRSAERVVVLGPGSAKTEFAAHVEREKPLQGRIEAVKTLPRLSPNQLVAFVKAHFKAALTA